MGLVDLVMGSSEQDVADEHFKQVFSGAQHILGFNAGIALAAQDILPTPRPVFTQSDDPFWADADNLAAINEIILAIQRRDQLKDMPTFDLGLSQDCPSSGCWPPCEEDLCPGGNRGLSSVGLSEGVSLHGDVAGGPSAPAHTVGIEVRVCSWLCLYYLFVY